MMWQVNTVMCMCVCLSYLAVVLGCCQVLVSSDGAKSSKLANICVEWLHRVVGVLGKYMFHLLDCQY